MAVKRFKGREMRCEISTDSGVSWKIVTDEQGFDLNPTTQFEEISSKDSCGNIERLPTRNEWTATVTGYLVTDVATTKLESDDLFDLWEAQTLLDVRFSEWDCSAGTVVSGGIYFEGQAYISAMPISSNNDEQASASIELQGTGALTNGTHP